MSEELRVDRTLGYGTAVYGNVFGVLTRRVCVYDLREKLLSHTALAYDQHRQVGRGHTQSHTQGPIQQLRVADNPETLLYGCYVNILSHLKVSSAVCCGYSFGSSIYSRSGFVTPSFSTP